MGTARLRMLVGIVSAVTVALVASSAGCGGDRDCQWLDVTGVAPGNYQIRVTVNPSRAFEEASFDNNATTVPVTVP